MGWYWWIVVYIAVGFVAYGVMYFTGEADKDDAEGIVFLWPLLIPMYLFYFARLMIERTVDAIKKQLSRQSCRRAGFAVQGDQEAGE